MTDELRLIVAAAILCVIQVGRVIVEVKRAGREMRYGECTPWVGIGKEDA